MYDADDLLPISALQHLIYCERQCALIHVEQTWIDNALTIEGTHLHDRADDHRSESRADILIARSLALRSRRLGIVGRADVVEFRRMDGGDGALLHGRAGRWQPCPIEYKRGRPKSHRADEVQLCAQAMCLEDQFDIHVSAGCLFYGATRRRFDVEFDHVLRSLTCDTIQRLRDLFARSVTPPAVHGKKCQRCSLRPACLPGAKRSATAYLSHQVESVEPNSTASR